MPRFLVIGAVLGVLLSGCVRSDEEVCNSYGFYAGTELFGQCMMQRQARRDQIMQSYWQAQQANQQQQMRIPPAGTVL